MDRISAEEWGVRWQEFDARGRMQMKEKVFGSRAQRDSFADRVEKGPNFAAFTSWMDGDDEAGFYRASEKTVARELVRIAKQLTAFQPNFNEAREFVEYLQDTLIPDLEESGMVETAKDFERVCVLIRQGRRDGSFIGYLKHTLVPDLKESGQVETAKDFEEGIYWLAVGRAGSARKAQWESLPEGWTKESLKSFYESLAGGGNAKDKFYSCVEKIKGTDITNPESFCGSLLDQFMDPSWRGVGR